MLGDPVQTFTRKNKPAQPIPGEERKPRPHNFDVFDGKDAVENIRGVRTHGVTLQPIPEPDRLVDTGFRIARIMNLDHRRLGDHIQALIQEYHEAHACRVYLLEEAERANVNRFKLEQRLSVEKLPGSDCFVTSETWPKAPEEGILMNKSFSERKPIVIDNEKRIMVVFDNLDMNDHGCDVYPLDHNLEGGRNHLALMPLYYRDPTSPFGMVVFEGVECSEANLGDFGRTFWTAKIAMAAASQISFALINRFDPVTGLTSKSDFNVDLKTCIRDLMRNDMFFLKLMLIDLDGFKQVNDCFSYRTGNMVLREVAKRLESSVRAGDFVSKWGGDEFAIILPEISMADACEIARRINHSVAQAVVKTSKGNATVSCSVGIVDIGKQMSNVFQGEVYYGEEETRHVERIAKDSFDEADELLKAAKTAGRNSIFYNEGGMRKWIDCTE